MSSDTPRPGTVNYGIHAGGDVHADVLAVGDGAQATKNVGSIPPSDVLHAIEQLQRGLADLKLQPQARQILDEDLTGLATAARGDKPDGQKAASHLKGVVDKLKMVGVVLGDVAALVEPVRKIAEALRIPLASLGVG